MADFKQNSNSDKFLIISNYDHEGFHTTEPNLEDIEPKKILYKDDKTNVISTVKKIIEDDINNTVAYVHVKRIEDKVYYVVGGTNGYLLQVEIDQYYFDINAMNTINNLLVPREQVIENSKIAREFFAEIAKANEEKAGRQF